MMKPSNPSRSHLETIQLSLQYASATAKASSAASRRFIFALKLSSTPSPPLQRLMESVYPSMSVPSLHEPLPVTLMQPETVSEQGFPFFDGIVFHIVRHIFHPLLPSGWLTINIADHQTTNTASHKTIITMQRKKGTRAGCPFSSHTNGLAQLEECRTLIEEVLQYLATSIWHQGARWSLRSQQVR